MRKNVSFSTKPGFTLFEVMLALLILVGLAGSIFGLARANLEMTNNVVEKQRQSMHRQAFFDLMRKQFSELPGNAVVDLTFDDPPGSGPYLSQLTFQNVPMVFSWGGRPLAVKAVQIETVVRRDGYLDIVMKYYDVEILEEDNATSDGREDEVVERAEPVARIVLLENVRWFEWQVLDSRTNEMVTEWQNPARQPILLQLDVAFGAEGENIRQMFWITPKQNPVAYMRQLGLSAGQGGGQSPGAPGGNGGGQEGEGGDGNGNQRPPGINIPGGGRPPGGGGRSGGQRPPGVGGNPNRGGR